jgi:DNA-binding beta-propeller fold protein YncE
VPRFAEALGWSLVAACLLAGCGSLSVHELPPAAEPPRSPAPASAAVGTLMRVGHAPEGVVADAASGLAAVALRDPDVLALVDVRRRRVVRRIALPGAPRHLALREGSRRAVLVPAETGDRLLQVALPSGRVTRRAVTGAYPHDVTALAGGGLAVSDERGGALTIVRRGGREQRVRVAAQPGGVTTLAAGRIIAVVSVRERVLELYDAGTLRRLARAPAGVGPTHVACLDQGPCYVLDTQGDALLVFRVGAGGRSLRLTRRVYLAGGPYGVALDASRRLLWVTLPGRNQLVSLPAHGRPHVISRRPTVRQPDSVAVDRATGTVLVTGRTGGLLQLVTP